MSHAESVPRNTALDRCVVGGVPAIARAASATGDAALEDRAFIALLNAYRAHGGVSRLCSLSVGESARSAGKACDVEDLVAAGELFSFEWSHALWVPMFQFAMPGPTVAVGPRRVVVELGRGFDGWALASWFVQPNAWLADHMPIACLGLQLPDVLQAARADRFVTTG